jgi:hypothetical protein
MPHAASDLRFSPDPDIAGRVLGRLFPWHDPGNDPWQTLLWANDRVDLPGLLRMHLPDYAAISWT